MLLQQTKRTDFDVCIPADWMVEPQADATRTPEYLVAAPANTEGCWPAVSAPRYTESDTDVYALITQLGYRVEAHIARPRPHPTHRGWRPPSWTEADDAAERAYCGKLYCPDGALHLFQWGSARAIWRDALDAVCSHQNAWCKRPKTMGEPDPNSQCGLLQWPDLDWTGQIITMPGGTIR